MITFFFLSHDALFRSNPPCSRYLTVLSLLFSTYLFPNRHSLLGWIYTLSWSLSFYPQPVLNIRRRSTIGSNFSFPTINTLGFLAYFISTSALYASPFIRAQYAARNPVSPEPTVRANDFAFAAHAFVLCLFTWTMYWKSIWGFEQEAFGKWRLGKGILGIIGGCILGVGCVVALVLIQGRNGGTDPEVWAWIDVVRSETLN